MSLEVVKGMGHQAAPTRAENIGQLTAVRAQALHAIQAEVPAISPIRGSESSLWERNDDAPSR